MKLIKRICTCALALLLVLSVLPTVSFADEAITMVEDGYDFTTFERIAEGDGNKDRVTNVLKDAGLFDVQNLFLAGNHEVIVNPGGYQGEGWITHKVDAAPGETIQNAVLNLGYWICNSSNQGYIQVWTSADNENYEMVWECKEGNGAAFYNSRRTENIQLPFADGQTTIYVKVVMQHWDTYEGAGVSQSKVTINVSSSKVESDKTPEECTMVNTSVNFNGLEMGEVDATQIGAIDEKNMFYGIDGVMLLSSRGGYEVASATWLLEAAEGEPLHDAVLTIVGRTYFQDAAQKDNNYLKVFASTDGVNFADVHTFHSNDNVDDTQRFTVDLTNVAKGYGKLYVKLEWLVFDSPHIMGIRSISITGNTTGIDNSEETAKMVVSNVQSFTALPVGAANADALGAFKAANLTFGYNKIPLLTPAEAGEDAYVTWKLTAPEGETFDDCYLTLIGRFGFINEDAKDNSVIRVHFSGDGEKYTEVREILPGEDQSDKQVVTVNLSARVFGLSEIYVRVYWSTKDEPGAMGLRAMALIGNAGADYEQYLPELEDRVITDEEIGGSATTDPTEPAPTDPAPTEPTVSDPGAAPANPVIWIVLAVVAVAVVVVIIVVVKKKKAA